MTKDEALKLALEGAANYIDVLGGDSRKYRQALAKPEPKCVAVVEVFGKDWRLDFMSLPVGKHKLYAQQYTYTAPTQQKHFGWKLVPIEPTNEMLKAMDECSTEGYDERLLAGHAASVYMAAVDVAPTPPKHKPLPPQSPCEMTQTEGKMFKLGWLECEAAHGIKE